MSAVHAEKSYRVVGAEHIAFCARLVGNGCQDAPGFLRRGLFVESVHKNVDITRFPPSRLNSKAVITLPPNVTLGADETAKDTSACDENIVPVNALENTFRQSLPIAREGRQVVGHSILVLRWFARGTNEGTDDAAFFSFARIERWYAHVFVHQLGWDHCKIWHREGSIITMMLGIDESH